LGGDKPRRYAMTWTIPDELYQVNPKSRQDILMESQVHKKWDQEADIVIVGIGFAGLAAPIEAKTAPF